MMMARIQQFAAQWGRRLHRDEGGAILLAALAGCIVIFMLALTLYDASKATRDKIDVQNAADVAAYSQAAVKARAMNMMSFTNIAKRTVVGIHNMYWGQYWGYMAWVSSRCGCCCCCSITCCNCFSCCCRDCWGNTPLLLMEGFTDWMTFSGVPIIPLVFGGESESVYAAELEALQDYQSYLADLTPWWAWSEQLIRGARNGATVTTSYPPPPDVLTVGLDWLDRILGWFGINLWPQTRMTDGLPVDRNDNWFGRMESCSPPFPFFSIMTPGSALEVWTNLEHYKSQSSKGPFIACDGPGSGKVANSWGMGMTVTACMFSALFSPIAEHMAPYYLSNSGFSFFSPGNLPDSAEDLMARSNIVFAYKHELEHGGIGQDRIHALVKGHYREHGMIQGEGMLNPVSRASGLWAFSRGELIHPRPQWGMGPHGTWMWHTGWSAKLRPLALQGEFADLKNELGYGGESGLNAMYHDVLPYLAGGAVLLGGFDSLVGGGEFSFTQLGWDLLFMEKVTRTMDDETSDGFSH